MVCKMIRKIIWVIIWGTPKWKWFEKWFEEWFEKSFENSLVGGGKCWWEIIIWGMGPPGTPQRGGAAIIISQIMVGLIVQVMDAPIIGEMIWEMIWEIIWVIIWEIIL